MISSLAKQKRYASDLTQTVLQEIAYSVSYKILAYSCTRRDHYNGVPYNHHVVLRYMYTFFPDLEFKMKTLLLRVLFINFPVCYTTPP